jgi:DNA-binding LacI/PurR family transcriptional regulator
VAARAGVSRQTVSNVINGAGRFSADTRERVLAAIDELSFQPNRYAQSLRSNRSGMLGFDMAQRQIAATDPFSFTFLSALVDAASAHDYRIIAFAHKDDDVADFRATATSGAVDGFVLSGLPADDQRVRILSETGVPFAVFGRTAADLPQTWVDIDNRAAMRLVVDHLVAAGHSTFGYVGYPNDDYWNHERYEGARRRLQDHGFDIAARDTIVGMPDEVGPRIRRLLQRSNHPRAIVTSSDRTAIQIVGVAGELGLRVGSELAITGFDGGPLQALIQPPITSVRVPVDRIARVLVERLMEELDGRPRPGGEIVPTQLVLGGTA